MTTDNIQKVEIIGNGVEEFLEELKEARAEIAARDGEGSATAIIDLVAVVVPALEKIVGPYAYDAAPSGHLHKDVPNIILGTAIGASLAGFANTHIKPGYAQSWGRAIVKDISKHLQGALDEYKKDLN